MANKTVRLYSHNDEDNVDALYIDNGNGTYSPNFIGTLDLKEDLKVGAKSIKLTLNGGAGSVQIPDTCTIFGVKPEMSTVMRIGLEVPEAEGTKLGDAVLSDLKKGLPLDVGVWTWFNIGVGASRTLYIIGGTADVIYVALT